MSDGPQRIASTAYGLAYAKTLPHLCQIAREHGYALAVHGSMATDLDLLACPWTEEAADPETLAETIREAIDGHFTGTAIEKPHGRRAWSIVPSAWIGCTNNLKWRPWIDLSVMPRKGSD